jgi:hypothetical protein
MSETRLDGRYIKTGSIPAATLGGGIVSSSGQVISALPSGTVSSSAQAVDWTVASASFALTASYVSGAAGDWDTLLNKPSGLVSASSQVDHNQTTNYVANQHIDHSTVNISAGNGLSGGGNITATRTLTLDTGSTHFTTAVKNRLSTEGVFSSSAQVQYSGITGVPSGIVSSSGQVTSLLPAGTVSASSQVSYTGLSNIPSGIVSSSTQIPAILPAGTVSASSQVNGANITNNTVSYTAGAGLSGGGAATLGGSAVTLDVNAGAGISVTAPTSDAININTGSAHFVTGSRGTISAANTTGASGINLTYNIATGIISGSLVNSTVTVNGSAISLGGSATVTANTTNALTLGAGLTGTSFNGSSAVTTTLDTGSTHFTNGVKTRLNVEGVYSSSAQVTAALPAGLFSSSAQVSHNSTTGYVANEHINHTTVSITAGSGLTGGGDISTTRTLTLDTGSTHFANGVKTRLNTEGVFSSSAQVAINSITGTLNVNKGGTGQTSYVNGELLIGNTTGNTLTKSTLTQGNGMTITNGTGNITLAVDTGSAHFTNGVKTRLNAEGVFSSSAQVQYGSISGVPAGIVSSSGQVTSLLPAGTVSASSQVSHNSTTGYVANEHINHSTVSISSGTGLTGGGDLTATRTLALTGQALALHNLATDGIIIRSGSGVVTARSIAVSGTGLSVTNANGLAGNPTITIGGGVFSSSAQVAHNSTTGYVANEHINHTTVSITAGSGLTGGGDLTATRTLTLDTGSAHFINGVKTRLNTETVISSSGQVVNSITGQTITPDQVSPNNLNVALTSSLNLVVANTVNALVELTAPSFTTNNLSVPLTASLNLVNGNTGSFAGPLSMRSYDLTTNPLGTGSGTRTIDLAIGNHFVASSDGTTTWVFSNPPPGRAVGFVLFLTNGGAHTQNWPTEVRWPGGVAPTLTASGTDVLTFVTYNTGTDWHGVVSILDTK